MRLGTALRSTLIGLAFGLGVAAPAVEAASPPLVEVSSSLVVSLGSANPVQNTFSIRVPLNQRWAPVIARLRATPPDTREYDEALQRTLELGGSFVDSDRDVSLVRSRPELLIADGVATISASLNGDLFPWELQDGVSMLLTRPYVVAEEANLTLSLRWDSADLDIATPLPTTQSADGELIWTFSAGSRAVVGVTPRRPFFDSSAAPTISRYLLFGLPFVLVLLLLTRQGRSTGTNAQLRRLSIGGSVLAISAAVSFGLASGDVLGVRRFLQQILFDDAQLPITTIALVGLVVFVWLAGPGKGRGWTLLVTLVAAGLFVALGRCTALGEAANSCAVAATPLMAALIAIVFGALSQMLVAVAPELATRRRSRWRRVMVAALALATIGQIMLASREAANALQGDGPVLLASSDAASADAQRKGEVLLNQLSYITPLILNIALIVLTTILAIGLALSLWRGLAARPEASFDSAAERRTVVLLFAIVVIGTGGSSHGYPAPLAFAVGLVGLPLLVARLAASRRAQLVRRPAVRAGASDLLARADRLTLLARRRDALTSDLAAGTIEEDVYDERRRALEERARSLRDVPPLVEAAVPDDKREGEIRALGLSAGQSVVDRLKALRVTGSLVVAIPLLYSLAVTLDDRAATAFSREQELGIPFLFASLGDQLVLWPIAAWCFLALFPILPGAVGPLKGLVLAAAFAIPSAAAYAVLDEAAVSTGGWLFIFLELLLLFVALGILLDYRAARAAGMRARQLGELYRITNVRSALVYLSPLVALILAVGQQLLSGDASSALSDLINGAPSLAPKVDP